jgi:hypothetical protein
MQQPTVTLEQPQSQPAARRYWYVACGLAALLIQLLSWVIFLNWFEPDEEYLFDERCYHELVAGCDPQEMSQLFHDLSLWPTALSALGAGGAVAWLVSQGLRFVFTGERASRLRHWCGLACGLLVAIGVGIAVYRWFVYPGPLVGQPGFLELLQQRNNVGFFFHLFFTPLVPITLAQYATLWHAGYPRHYWVPLSLCSGLLLCVPFFLQTNEQSSTTVQSSSVALSLGIFGLYSIIFGLLLGLVQLPLLRGTPIRPLHWLLMSMLVGPLLMISPLPLIVIPIMLVTIPLIAWIVGQQFRTL